MSGAHDSQRSHAPCYLALVRTFMRILPGLVVVACGHAGSMPARTGAPGPEPSTGAAPPVLDAMFDPVKALVGSWQGDDPERHSTGRFTLTPELAGKILVRRSTNESPEGRHEDFMVIFKVPSGLRASYWDNEGHTINYTITGSANHIEFLSDEVPNAPRFKLTYDPHGGDELAIDFSIAMPGTTELKHYTGGIVQRVRS